MLSLAAGSQTKSHKTAATCILLCLPAKFLACSSHHQDHQPLHPLSRTCALLLRSALLPHHQKIGTAKLMTAMTLITIVICTRIHLHRRGRLRLLGDCQLHTATGKVAGPAGGGCSGGCGAVGGLLRDEGAEQPVSASAPRGEVDGGSASKRQLKQGQCSPGAPRNRAQTGTVQPRRAQQPRGAVARHLALRHGAGLGRGAGAPFGSPLRGSSGPGMARRVRRNAGTLWGGAGWRWRVLSGM